MMFEPPPPKSDTRTHTHTHAPLLNRYIIRAYNSITEFNIEDLCLFLITIIMIFFFPFVF